MSPTVSLQYVEGLSNFMKRRAETRAKPITSNSTQNLTKEKEVVEIKLTPSEDQLASYKNKSVLSDNTLTKRKQTSFFKK